MLYTTEPGPITMTYFSKESILKHKKGNVLSYDLKTDKLSVIKRNLDFPNGIAYEASKQAVIFSELSQHRLVRLFVDGPRKGETQVIL